MKIILSPTKQMKQDNDTFTSHAQPALIEKTEYLLSLLQKMNEEELQKMYSCNEKIAKQNYERIQNMKLDETGFPAVFSYKGLAFQHLCPDSMTDRALAYLEEHLRILSGFYGILKPFDNVHPYRLEMGNVIPTVNSLYEYWGSDLYRELDDSLIINLASKEYADAVSPYLRQSDRMIDIVFGEWKKNKVITKGTFAKMKRGDMVWWMAENNITDPEEIRKYHDGYAYREDLSDEKHYVFLKK